MPKLKSRCALYFRTCSQMRVELWGKREISVFKWVVFFIEISWLMYWTCSHLLDMVQVVFFAIICMLMPLPHVFWLQFFCHVMQELKLATYMCHVAYIHPFVIAFRWPFLPLLAYWISMTIAHLCTLSNDFCMTVPLWGCFMPWSGVGDMRTLTVNFYFDVLKMKVTCIWTDIWIELSIGHCLISYIYIYIHIP